MASSCTGFRRRWVHAPGRAREESASDVEALLAMVAPRPASSISAIPNNPTGSYLTAAEVKELRRRLPAEVLLAIDAAYAEYVEAADYDAGEALVRAGDNVVMLRTFSKIYGLAGLRLGWAYCPPGSPMRSTVSAGPSTPPPRPRPPPWRRWRTRPMRKRAGRITGLARLAGETLAASGYRVHPSVGNFLLVEFADADAADAFLKSRGLIMRKMGGYGLPHCLRITIGSEAETRATAAALADYAGGRAAAETEAAAR
jgi:Histidinol-phosphate/aromatic aminotransferase and cobyric acid decarboxylase